MEVVRNLRMERGWTQRKLAHKARTSQHTISEIELGLRDPHPTTLRKIAEALGVSVAELSAEEPADPEAGEDLFAEEPTAPEDRDELWLEPPAQQRDFAVNKALRTYFRDLRLRWNEPANKPTPGQIRDALDLLQHLTDHGAFGEPSTSQAQSEVDLLYSAAYKLRPIAETLAKENEAAWLQDMIEEVFECLGV